MKQLNRRSMTCHDTKHQTADMLPAFALKDNGSAFSTWHPLPAVPGQSLLPFLIDGLGSIDTHLIV